MLSETRLMEYHTYCIIFLIFQADDLAPELDNDFKAARDWMYRCEKNQISFKNFTAQQVC